MSNYIVSDTNLTAVADAIRTKGGTSSPLEFPSEFVSAINAIPSGGGSVESKDVNFYDYDGTLVESYSAADFANLAAMPNNPSHTGLTAQGWNWSLADAKTYVASNGKLNIGQMYVTDDGKTRLYIHIVDSHRLDVPLYWAQTVANGVTIDWGDNSATQTFSGTGSKNTTHSYPAIGDYVITLNPAEGCTLQLGDGSYACLGSKRAYLDMLKKVNFGVRVSAIPGSAFANCYYLESVTMSSAITSTIGQRAFQSAFRLKGITIPSGLTSISGYAFSNDRHLVIITIPKSVMSLGGQVANNCFVLKSVTIPSGAAVGNNAFNGCYNIESVTIASGVNIASGAFGGCSSIESLTIASGVSIGNNAFGSCSVLESVTIASGVSFGTSVFSDCYSIESVTIPNDLTSIETGTFNNCFSLESITFPSGITSIGASAFNNCEGMAEYDFSACTAVPTLANTNAFTGIPADCKMLIPTSLYSTWSTANIWSDYASYMVAV